MAGLLDYLAGVGSPAGLLPAQSNSLVTGTITERKPTTREKVSNALQDLLETMGVERYSARKYAQSIIGGEQSNLPLGMGLLGLAGKAGAGASGMLDYVDAPENGPAMAATVWHGSPHKFDKFDSAHIGKGEGAQAYGHGLYLAESPDVAKSYADSVSRLHGATTTVEGAGRKVPVPLWAADRVKSDGIDFLIDEWSKRLAESQARAKTSLQPWIDQGNAARFAQQLDELKAIKTGGSVAVEAPGSLYKVDLPDTAIARMLDWDKPLSQQAPEVISGLRNGGWLDDAGNIVDTISTGPAPGQTLYNIMAGRLNVRKPGPSSAEAKATEELRRLGIPGIKYLDGMSRSAGQGTRNYVVFPGEEGLLTILERNGVKP